MPAIDKYLSDCRYNKIIGRTSSLGSKMHVLTNASLFCMQTGVNKPKGLTGRTYTLPQVNSSMPLSRHVSDRIRLLAGTDPDPSTTPCRDDGTGKVPAVHGAFDDIKTTWVAVDITVGADGVSLELDLAGANITEAYAIRYAWQGDCCSENPATSEPCPIKSCPLYGAVSMLPANPFMA